MSKLKEDLIEKLMQISENADEYDEVGMAVIRRCKKLFTKLNSINPDDQNKLFKIKFEIDEFILILKEHKSGKVFAHGRLASKFTIVTTPYMFIILIMIYSLMYITIDNVGMDNSTEYLYIKYLVLSMLGAMFFFITTYYEKFNKSLTKLLIACFVPILFVGVLFTKKDGNIDFANAQLVVFLLGYGSNLVVLIINKATEKFKATLNI
ncbi:hypothetical protein [Paenibacillus brasilensis]|uniref:Uncharacterized protein n=1 Tax=Paenibacillus brasilensis TaxID=128574 RepID=A0ABU0L524_9BACL|nr:hypothetical protein [Paenibacillus brasilensis]MDQ0496375.1 hypothetical protein [Paenibacillus brasilensis]